MKTEFEAKFYPFSKNKARKKLKEIGAKLIHKEREMKRAHFGDHANDGMEVHYIRVRDEGDKISLSAKIHARKGEKLHVQKETEVEVNDFDSTREILKLSGLTETGYQTNKRETWEYDGAKIEIDTWPSLDTYIEIEAENEEKVREIAELLGKRWDERIVTSVAEIYADKYSVSLEVALRRIDYCSFEEPPF